MKRIGIVVVAIILSACTPGQGARWLTEWIGASPEKQAVMEQKLQEYEQAKAEATSGRPCAEWYDLAYEAGFTPEQWKEPISRIMYRESHCNPGAKNPHSTAAGLMQELRMWADDCGGVYADLFDPTFNLNCAYHIYQVQGWRAWATY